MFTSILYNVIGIILVVGVSSFAITLVADLLLFALAPKYNGVYFNRQSKNARKRAKTNKFEKVEALDVENEKEVTISPYAIPTITPFVENENVEHDVNYQPVDFEKAVEEQKRLQAKEKPQDKDFYVPRKIDNRDLLTSDEDDEIEDEEDISEIISVVQEQAMQEIAMEGASVEPEMVVEEEFAAVEPIKSDRSIKPKIIFKTIIKEQVAPKEEIVEPEPVLAPVIDEEKEYDELRKIREDIFNLRKHAVKDIKSSKTGIVSTQTKQEVEQLESGIREKLNELEGLKQYQINAENEKLILIETNKEVTSQKNKLQIEVDELEKELESLKTEVGLAYQPFYSKEYYENMLLDLELQLSDAGKELRKNGREFNPLRRIKRTFDRDLAKLKRKEIAVAKQQLRIYGVNNTDKIDPEKVAKLQTEIEVLNKLKESVHTCDAILKRNKDRYPVLEKANEMYAKHVETLKKDIESVKKAIKFYAEEEGQQN